MNRIQGSLLVLLSVIWIPALLAAPPQAKRKSGKQSKAAAYAAVPTANPKQENQFVTVDEFVKAKLAARTPVSVEGYAVTGFRAADGSLRLVLVDSIDHVLSPTDADNFGRSGAAAAAPPSILARKPSWGWTQAGTQRFAMYRANGLGKAQAPLHDVVAKVRLTGFATGRLINPVTKIEFQDESGEWKVL